MANPLNISGPSPTLSDQSHDSGYKLGRAGKATKYEYLFVGRVIPPTGEIEFELRWFCGNRRVTVFVGDKQAKPEAIVPSRLEEYEAEFLTGLKEGLEENRRQQELRH